MWGAALVSNATSMPSALLSGGLSAHKSVLLALGSCFLFPVPAPRLRTRCALISLLLLQVEPLLDLCQEHFTTETIDRVRQSEDLCVAVHSKDLRNWAAGRVRVSVGTARRVLVGSKKSDAKGV
jgi:hypothetical protein